MKKAFRLATGIFLCLALSAYAADPGVYSGFGMGPGMIKTPTPSSLNKKVNLGFNGRAFGGYNFTPYFGVETGYARYAHSSLNKAEVNNTGYALNAVDVIGKRYFSFEEGDLNIYLLGGVAYSQDTVTHDLTSLASITAASATNNNSRTYNQFRPVYGVGADYDLSGAKFSTNLEVTRIQGSGDAKTNPNALPTSDLLTWDISYHFD